MSHYWAFAVSVNIGQARLKWQTKESLLLGGCSHLLVQLGLPPSGSRAREGATTWSVAITRTEGSRQCGRLYTSSKASLTQQSTCHSCAHLQWPNQATWLLPNHRDGETQAYWKPASWLPFLLCANHSVSGSFDPHKNHVRESTILYEEVMAQLVHTEGRDGARSLAQVVWFWAHTLIPVLPQVS